jgi:hypothetical protein
MLGFFIYCMMAYFAFNISQIYYLNNLHLVQFDRTYTLFNNKSYVICKNLIIYATFIYFFENFYGINLEPNNIINLTNNLLISTFYISCILNLIKISHGVFFDNFNYFLVNLLKILFLYFKIVIIKMNSLSADNIIFNTFYFLYLLIQ